MPISIAALSETDLERRGEANAGDLISTLPNLTGFAGHPGARGSLGINMRGIGAGSPSGRLGRPRDRHVPGRGLYRRAGRLLPADVAELRRVEVLRGPQGTLYGRNSAAGAIGFITVRAYGEMVGGKFTGEMGSDSLWGVEGTVCTDTLGTVGEEVLKKFVGVFVLTCMHNW
ncbi:MAG: TonB-dependent receptor plug domain-containing protein, partial [Desulfobacterales bacterium]|nr:TonB-dependent receptor plug domain-containing protein [Desulfobacterales bacterium]